MVLPISVAVSTMPAWVKVEGYLPILAGVAVLYKPLILEQVIPAIWTNGCVIFRIYNLTGGTN